MLIYSYFGRFLWKICTMVQRGSWPCKKVSSVPSARDGEAKRWVAALCIIWGVKPGSKSPCTKASWLDLNVIIIIIINMNLSLSFFFFPDMFRVRLCPAIHAMAVGCTLGSTRFHQEWCSKFKHSAETVGDKEREYQVLYCCIYVHVHCIYSTLDNAVLHWDSCNLSRHSV